MHHVFILNPAAGKGRAVLELKDKIINYFSQHKDLDYSIRLTECHGDATRIAREECEKNENLRLYACGGDGTLQETANGVPVGSSAEITAIPCGSGNDYVRIYASKEAFLNLPDLINGEAVLVDAVDCGAQNLSLNIASIGMDAKVCAKMIQYKHLPGIGGSLAYELAIVDTFFHPIGSHMNITIQGENGTIERNGDYLMALAANGQYYGGGYHGAPQAIENDGILDFVLIKKISRLSVPRFLNKYKRGDYADLPYCEHIRGYHMAVETEKPTYCNVDGECTCQDRMTFSIIPKAFRFVLPKTVALRRASSVPVAVTL